MIPRLNPRGQSFFGACTYVLHDIEKATTKDRVGWSMTLNLATQDVKWAWHEMTETYWAQDALKQASGTDLRGRKNDKPVLHYSLSWAPSENPTQEQMREAAISSLKALGLSEHEALIAAHTDKKHPHLHIVVNTVHPQTGRTADLKFSKLALSRWAQEYEQEHGLHCEERVKNNEDRKKQKSRRLDPTDLLMGRKHGPNTLLMSASKEQDGRAPYVPIKARTVSRKIWLDKKEVIDRMKAMRRELDAEIKGAQGELWKKQVAERDALDQQTETAIDEAMHAVGDHYRPYWREIYKVQRQEVKRLARYLGELKDYKARVREYERKNGIKRAPSVRDDMAQAADPKKDPMAELLRRHEQHKRALSRQHRGDAKGHSDAIMARHREQFEELRSQQESERHTARDALREAAPPITFAAAKEAIIEDRENARRRRFKRLRKLRGIKRAFDKANEIDTPAKKRLRKMAHRTLRTTKGHEAHDRTKASAGRNTSSSRADEIKRDMAAWRPKNRGRDRGREM
jgi:hypothetical protein